MARGSLVSELRTVADDPAAVLAYVESQGWGDGLPVIPPTEERVQAMLDATPLSPAHVVGVIEPRRGEATVEKIAVNAVLAGCDPAYFPAVLAAVEAVRALRLVMRNVGGSIPGAVSKSVFGQPGRVSLCFGEWEERSPWPPFHVRRGFAPSDSVLTATCATG